MIIADDDSSISSGGDVEYTLEAPKGLLYRWNTLHFQFAVDGDATSGTIDLEIKRRDSFARSIYTELAYLESAYNGDDIRTEQLQLKADTVLPNDSNAQYLFLTKGPLVSEDRPIYFVFNNETDAAYTNGRTILAYLEIYKSLL
jgi:hypothetical protein